MRAITVFLVSFLLMGVSHAAPSEFYHKQADKFWRVAGITNDANEVFCYGLVNRKDGAFIEIHRSLTDGEVWVGIRNPAWNLDPNDKGTMTWNFYGGGQTASTKMNFSAQDNKTIEILQIPEKQFFDFIAASGYFTLVLPNNQPSVSFAFQNRGTALVSAITECVAQNEGKYGQAAGSPARAAVGQTAGGGGSLKEVDEQSTNAQPAPTDGSLITSDGRGLRFSYHYLPPTDAKFNSAYQWAVDTHLFSTMPEIDGMDGIFVLPSRLRYIAMQCGHVNAFYATGKSSVILCYELIDLLEKVGRALSKGMANPDAFVAEFVRDNVRFILLHETGHAFIDMMQLPAVGREEDSVDQLATVLLLIRGNQSKNDIARVLQLASTWFAVLGIGQNKSLSAGEFSDEHSLDIQRYYNILCIAYGTDPDEYRSLVSSGKLPQERAQRCPEEATKVTRSWLRLLAPHISPFLRNKVPGNAKDNSGGEQQSNPLEWNGKSNPFGG